MSTRRIFSGFVRGDLLDVHSAGGRGHEGDAAALAVEQDRKVELALDRAAGFDVDVVHREARRAGLGRHEALAEHRLRGLADFLRRTAQLHAAGLAAPARVDLGLDDPDRSRQFPRRGGRLGRRRRHAALRHGHSVVGEDALRLVFVKIHHGIVAAGLNRVANAGRAAGRPQVAW